MLLVEDPTIISKVGEALRAFVEVNPGKSIKWIIDQSGVNKNKVYSILDPTRRTILSTDEIYKLLKATGNLDLYNELKTDIVSTLNYSGYSIDPSYVQHIKDSDLHVPLSFSTVLSDIDRYLVYECCCRPQGASKETLESIRGIDNLDSTINDLLGFGMISMGENGNYHSIKKHFGLSLLDTAKVAKQIPKLLNSDNFGKNRNMVVVEKVVLSRSAVKKGRMIVDKCWKDLIELEKNNPGDYEMIFSGFFDALHNEVFKDGDENE